MTGQPLGTFACCRIENELNQPVNRNPIIVALDVAEVSQAENLVTHLAPHVGAFKIGKELFTTAGPEIVRFVRSKGAAVFLDLKFHDIPNTVAKAVAAATRLDVQMLTIHTSGGLEMMKAAEEAAQNAAGTLGRTPPLVLGVTVLTSMDASALDQIGIRHSIGVQVELLATLAHRAGLRGLVCSPLEIPALRGIIPREMQLVTPGIRGQDDPKGDQKRTLSAEEAMNLGADWLVIGRPICAAPDPAAAARRILESIRLGAERRASQ